MKKELENGVGAWGAQDFPALSASFLCLRRVSAVDFVRVRKEPFFSVVNSRTGCTVAMDGDSSFVINSTQGLESAKI